MVSLLATMKSLPVVTQQEAKKARADRRVSQEALAKLIGVAPNTYHLWEKEKRQLPRDAMLALYAWVKNGEIPPPMMSAAEELICNALDQLSATIRSPTLDPVTKARFFEHALNGMAELAAAWKGAQQGNGGGS